MELHEPLEESAPIAWRLAPELCRREPNDCSWLHGFWQCLRLLGLAATPERHRDFYEQAFARVAAEGQRVLISGAADYSMLAHALAALRARGMEPSLTVIDACETPLHLCRWYAERLSCRIETHRCGVLDYSPAAPFDAVCTHSFLGMFSRSERPALLAAWRRLLRPGGVVITAHPLRRSDSEEPNRFTAGQAQALRAIVAENSARLAALLQVEPADIAHGAERYLNARYGYPVHSAEELRALFEHCGFRIDHLECRTAPSDGRRELGGPGLRTPNVQYAHLIAVRD